MGAVSAPKTDNRRTLGITSINNYLQCSGSLPSFAIKELDYEGANVFKGRGEEILEQRGMIKRSLLAVSKQVQYDEQLNEMS